MYDRARDSRAGPSAVCGRSTQSGGERLRDGRIERSCGRSLVSVTSAGSAGKVGCGFSTVGGGDAALGRITGSGAEDILLLCRRTNSASSFFTGDAFWLKMRLGFGEAGSKSAIALETGTLLDVVLLKSSNSKAIWCSGRSASRLMTWSTEERDRWWDLVGILASF